MSAVYPKFREMLLSQFLAGTNVAVTGFKVLGVSGAYTYDAAHTGIEAIAVESIVVPATPLADVTTIDGILDANDVPLVGLDTTKSLDALIVFVEFDSESQLVCYIDGAQDGTIPATIDAEQGSINWAAEGICRI